MGSLCYNNTKIRSLAWSNLHFITWELRMINPRVNRAGCNSLQSIGLPGYLLEGYNIFCTENTTVNYLHQHQFVPQAWVYSKKKKGVVSSQLPETLMTLKQLERTVFSRILYIHIPKLQSSCGNNYGFKSCCFKKKLLFHCVLRSIY